MTVAHVLNVVAQKAGNEAEKLADIFRSYGDLHWLSPAKAFDIALTDTRAEILPQTILTQAREHAANVKADINLVATAERRKKLLIADMDSTIITAECLDELADFAGLKSHIAAITERAMRGEIEFAGALRERVGLLKGLPLGALQSVWNERIHLTPGAKSLLTTMKAHGARALLVSGGFGYFTSRVAAAAGFDEDRANHLIDDGEKLTGAVGEPILGKEAKLAALEDEAARLGLSLAQTLAVGDGANDLAMIGRASKAGGLGVAFHAKPVVAAAAGARIDHGDLCALLYLQGYTDADIIG
ncbi:MAG: phosphoserine phosphatase SerB [Rhizomicrobium sp.]